MRKHMVTFVTLALASLAATIVCAQPANEAEIIAKIEQAGGKVYKISAADSSREICFHLASQPVGDEQLGFAVQIPDVIWLNLAGTKITDDGLKQIAGMKQLKRLHLEKTQIGDVGLDHLLGLAELEYLNLYGTQVTDAGAAKLAAMKNLKKVYFWQSQVSEEGIKSLQTALPDCQVVGEVKLTPVAPPEQKPDPAAKPADAPVEEKKEPEPPKKDDGK